MQLLRCLLVGLSASVFGACLAASGFVDLLGTSVYLGIYAAVHVIFTLNTREPTAGSASTHEVLATTIGICICVAYILLLPAPVFSYTNGICMDVLRPILIEWWPTPRPPPPPCNKFIGWCFHLDFSGMLDWFFPMMMLGSAAGGAVLAMPAVLLLTIAGIYAQKNNFTNAFSIEDKCS